MHRLATRCRHGTWAVLVPISAGDSWIPCRSMQDARQMSMSGNLAFDAIERQQAGEEVAQELEAAARLFFQYDCHERAIWLAEHAKFARGEPTVFGDSHSDQG
jgi:hypothetical protein